MNDENEDLIEAHRGETHFPPTHVVQRWHNAIDEAAALQRGRDSSRTRGWQPSSFFRGIAITGALALGVGIGYFASDLSHEPVPALLAETDSSPDLVPAAFTRGLQVHLRNSQQQIAGLDGDSNTTMLVLQIVEQNRLFESAADRNNAQSLARVLRAFEPILLRLAASDIAPEDAEELRAQLSFKLNVMLTKLARQSSDESHST